MPSLIDRSFDESFDGTVVLVTRRTVGVAGEETIRFSCYGSFIEEILLDRISRFSVAGSFAEDVQAYGDSCVLLPAAGTLEEDYLMDRICVFACEGSLEELVSIERIRNVEEEFAGSVSIICNESTPIAVAGAFYETTYCCRIMTLVAVGAFEENVTVRHVTIEHQPEDWEKKSPGETTWTKQ